MMKKISESKCFSGKQQVYEHASIETNCNMKFGLFLPPGDIKKIPLIIWLSGLTCTEQNFIIKSNMQELAVKYGVAVLNPDTSPRGFGFDGEDDDYAFGTGAGFYVDATQQPLSEGYRMYSYVTKELPALIKSQFDFDMSRVGVMGHSMGGHGALMVALRNPALFKTVSAFSPISSVMQSPWGQNALGKYLGDDMQTWQQYDVVELLSDVGWQGPEIRVDVGTEDEFLHMHLKPELLEMAAKKTDSPLVVHMHEGYDHSFYFIRTFLEEHFKAHTKHL